MADDPDDRPRSDNTVGDVRERSAGNIHAGEVQVGDRHYHQPPAEAPPTEPPDPLRPPDGPIPWRTPDGPPAPDPANPYPLLHPIRHPDALGGREAELSTLLDRIDRSDGLLALYAPSGQGKSSLLIAGLMPRLRDAETRATLRRHPDQPGLGRALVADLIDAAVPALPDDDPRPFAAWLARLHREAGHRPVLVLDQFEAIFKVDPEGEDRPDGQLTARARVGLLLAATVDPGGQRHPCRWVLAYREEFHGRVQRWLGDVLAEAPHWKDRLPSRLTPDSTVTAEPLPPLGGVPGADAKAAFVEAIDKPLALVGDAGWRFEADGADRLAAAFAAVRTRPSTAPLVPELQVVLGRLVRDARDAGRKALVVPDDTAGLIDGALRRHLVEALNTAFVAHEDKTTARTMALLALGRLADTQGRAIEDGLPREALTPLASDAVLRTLSGPDARLVVPLDEGREARVRLSHDRLAAVLADVDRAEVFGPGAGFDPRLLDLAGRVGLRAAQYAQTRDSATLALGPRDLWRANKHPELLWDDTRRAWWGKVKRRVATLAGAALATLLAAVVIYQWVQETQRRTRIDEAIAQVEGSASPEAILTGLQTLMDEEAAAATLDRLIDAAPLAAAEGTPDRPVEAARARFIRRRLVGDRPAESAQDFGRLIAGVEAGWHPEAPARLDDADRRRLRADIRVVLKQRFPGEPPPIDWQPVAGGTFMMGDHQQVGLPNQRPVHQVTLPAFDLGRTEVTMGQYRAFDPEVMAEKNAAQPGMAAFIRDKGPAADRLPMWMIDWHEAWAFALWADPVSRLPTEAEWEYAARGGPHAPEIATRYWSGDDGDDLRAVDWIRDNPRGRPREVCQPPDPERRHPLDLCDVHGNLFEWVADWRSDAYPAGPAHAPLGPRRGALRVFRGGSFDYDAFNARSAYRGGLPPSIRLPNLGFRLARSAPSSSIER